VLGGDTVDTVGDEALLHSALAPTWVGRDRLTLAQLAAAAGASQLLLDDGMQHWRLSPTISLLVIDGSVGLGNGRLLPAGGLREPWAAVVARADALLILGEDSQQLAKCWPAIKPLLRGQLAVEQAQQEVVANRRWLAFAGIGRPEKFWDSLRAVGAELAAVQAFADHHSYRAGELEQLAHRAAKLSAGLITTRKDWVRLPPEWQQRVQVLEVALQLDSDSLAAMDRLLQRLVDTSV
jgi:tetraacyldisaccharide 4'-kinase